MKGDDSCAPISSSSTILHVIIFSKDRAWQLHECLRSLFHFLVPIPDDLPSSDHPHFTVIYTTTPGCPYEASYAKVASCFPRVKFVQEIEGGFHDQLVKVLDAVKEEEFVMWAVDDLIAYRYWDIRYVTSRSMPSYAGDDVASSTDDDDTTVYMMNVFPNKMVMTLWGYRKAMELLQKGEVMVWNNLLDVGR